MRNTPSWPLLLRCLMHPLQISPPVVLSVRWGYEVSFLAFLLLQMLTPCLYSVLFVVCMFSLVFFLRAVLDLRFRGRGR